MTAYLQKRQVHQVTRWEKKVTALIELSRELNRENRALKLRAAELQRERRELLERQRQASEHVETSLARLRSLDGSA